MRFSLQNCSERVRVIFLWSVVCNDTQPASLLWSSGEVMVVFLVPGKEIKARRGGTDGQPVGI